MLQAQPTLQNVLNMVYSLSYNDQMQLVSRVQYNLALNDHEPLIDLDWRKKPLYAWDDVYEQLCRDLGEHYGLNDIREAK